MIINFQEGLIQRWEINFTDQCNSLKKNIDIISDDLSHYHNKYIVAPSIWLLIYYDKYWQGYITGNVLKCLSRNRTCWNYNSAISIIFSIIPENDTLWKLKEEGNIGKTSWLIRRKSDCHADCHAHSMTFYL